MITKITINCRKWRPIAKPKGLLGGPLVKELILNKKDVSSLGRHLNVLNKNANSLT